MIRKATISDAAAIAECHRSAIQAVDRKFYSQEQVLAWSRGKDPEKYLSSIAADEIYIEDENGTPLGFDWLKLKPPEVRAVYVTPMAQGRGVGSKLLAFLERILRAQGDSEVTIGASLNAVEFYGNHGYREVSKSALEMSGVSVPFVLMTKKLAGDTIRENQS